MAAEERRMGMVDIVYVFIWREGGVCVDQRLDGVGDGYCAHILENIFFVVEKTLCHNNKKMNCNLYG